VKAIVFAARLGDRQIWRPHVDPAWSASRDHLVAGRMSPACVEIDTMRALYSSRTRWIARPQAYPVARRHRRQKSGLFAHRTDVSPARRCRRNRRSGASTSTSKDIGLVVGHGRARQHQHRQNRAKDHLGPPQSAHRNRARVCLPARMSAKPATGCAQSESCSYGGIDRGGGDENSGTGRGDRGGVVGLFGLVSLTKQC
jgi:hypothetical protein